MKSIALDNEQEKKRKLIAIIITVVFHGVLLLLFAFMGLTHQVPPPPEYGIEVDMGGGGGGSSVQTSQTINASRPATSAARDNVSTQDQEETTTLNTSRRTDPRPTTTQTTPSETAPVEETPTVNPNALFKRNTNKGGEAGNGTGTKTGPGAGDGDGDMSGKVKGNYGGDFYLDGRPVVTKAFPNAKNNLEGLVKVDFRADRDGNVVYAKAGAKGTTINDLQIWEECEKAAKRSKFKAKSDAQVEEKGVITYRFVLQ